MLLIVVEVIIVVALAPDVIRLHSTRDHGLIPKKTNFAIFYNTIYYT